VRNDQSKAVTANRGSIHVDGDPDAWSKLASQRVHLTTGGRGAMECDVRFAWDDQFFYVLAEQTSPAKRVHEADSLEKYSAAVWDFDGVWLYFDLGNGKVPSIGDFILSMAMSSSGAATISKPCPPGSRGRGTPTPWPY
jgi:hypothetical protein